VELTSSDISGDTTVLIDGIALSPIFGGTVPILRDPLVIPSVTGMTPLDAALA
jgi:hypothetical protein